MDAGVERDRARHFHVAPRSDDDAVATADLGVDDELRLADRAVVEQGADEAVHRVAAKVLSHRQDPATLRGSGDDAVAAAR